MLPGMTLARITLVLSGLAFALAGLAFLAAPAAMTGNVGVELTSVTADNDIRAVYGGLEIGLGIFFLVCLRRPEWFRPGVLAATLALARALERDGRIAEARTAYERVIHLAPDSAEAKTARQRRARLPRPE